MSVNSFNPRLFSSSSSENDVDEVFRHKAGSVAPVDVTLPSAKSRCFSEPAQQNGKDGKKEESRSFGKTPALSDSSNVLRRQKGRFTIQNGIEKPSVSNDSKLEIFSPISEEASSQISPESDKDKSKNDNVFPEPESNRREATKDAYRYSILLEEVESIEDDVIPNIRRGQELEGAGMLEFEDDIDIENMGALESADVFMRDIGYGTTDGDAGVHDANQQIVDVDDDSYPEKEYYPSGYPSCVSEDLPYISNSWDLPRTILRSYATLDLGKAPELPDDLINDSGIYPDIDKYFDNLSPAVVPGSPLPSPDYEMKMKLFFADDY